ncbi:hypothetical protein [Massilibacteroides vaginae]|uniref:hypothetical protein n=1 Tax=Massilibacteroides vaginae TaxID=1673718 RepID=UPI000A1CA340|nr:hypothetical protein [Massilibacteroides vaginae]
MIKKILSIGCFAAIAAAIGFNANKSINEVSVTELIATNTEALADCPNGCVANGGGCWCNGPYSGYKEYGGW